MGIGNGNGNGLMGLVIIAMARVWLICVLVPLSSRPGAGPVGRGVDAGAGRGVGLVCRLDAVDPDRRGGRSLGLERIDMRGKFVLPGRGLVEFCRRGNDDMVAG